MTHLVKGGVGEGDGGGGGVGKTFTESPGRGLWSKVKTLFLTSLSQISLSDWRTRVVLWVSRSGCFLRPPAAQPKENGNPSAIQIHWPSLNPCVSHCFDKGSVFLGPTLETRYIWRNIFHLFTYDKSACNSPVPPNLKSLDWFFQLHQLILGIAVSFSRDSRWVRLQLTKQINNWNCSQPPELTQWTQTLLYQLNSVWSTNMYVSPWCGSLWKVHRGPEDSSGSSPDPHFNSQAFTLSWSMP